MPGRERNRRRLAAVVLSATGRTPGAPQPYFHEDQDFAVAGDEIDFAAAAIVALNDRRAAPGIAAASASAAAPRFMASVRGIG
jgi:hypothetical protein